MASFHTISSGEQPLRSLGVSEPEEQLYRWLLGHPGVSAHQISEAIPLHLRKTRHLLNALESIGFVTHTPEHPRRYTPTAPGIAVEALVRSRRDILDRALGVIPELREQVVSDTRNHEKEVELITSRAAQRQVYEQLPETAQEEIIFLMRPPMLISRLDIASEEDRPSQRRAQERGVRFRGIVDTAYLELPGALRSTREDVKAGEKVRAVSYLPFKMVMADRRTAFIPLNLEQPDSPSLLLRSSALLDALYSLFEVYWKSAASVSFTRTDELEIEKSTSPQPQVEDLITLLSAGLNDKAIIQELGVSQRTLLRRVSELMRHLGARTRFQAGWLAALRFSGSRGRKASKDKK